MFRRILQLFVGVMLLSFPLFAFSQTAQGYLNGQEGVVRPFVFDDPNLFNSKISQKFLVDSELRAEYGFKLLLDDGSFIDLDSSIDWSKFANRRVAVSGSVVVDKNGRTTLRVIEKSLIVLDENPYANTTIPAVTQGDYKVLSIVITVQQPGAIETSLTDPSFMSTEQALAPVFHNPKSARVFFAEASGGRLNVVGHLNPSGGDVAFVTITSAITDCNSQMSVQWVPLVDAQLRAQGIEPNWYNSTVFIYDNMPGCGTQSLGTVGWIGLLNQRQYIFTNKNTVIGRDGDSMVSHEIGHNLGLSHSNAYRCTDSNNIPASCTVVEYGDRACFMGSLNMLPNNYQRRRLGWYSQPFKQLIYSGSYNVYSPSIPGQSGAKRLMSCQFCFAPLTGALTGFSVYPEARRNYQLFDDLEQSGTLLWPYKRGVKLLIGIDDLVNLNAKPFILDTTPQDTSTYNAPLVLQSYSVGGVLFNHTGITSASTGSRLTITLP